MLRTPATVESGEATRMIGTTVQFPNTYGHHSTATLIAAFAEGPHRLRSATFGLESDDLRARPRPGKWSVLEIALHVVDSELMGAGPIRLVLAQPGAAFAGYDQDAWARELQYQKADCAQLERALALFALLRAETLRLLDRADGVDWSNTGVHQESGTVTLRSLLELYADHAERHIAQILECRRLLGRAVELPPRLPDRLY